jgi:hypothetical protein
MAAVDAPEVNNFTSHSERRPSHFLNLFAILTLGTGTALWQSAAATLL